MSPFLSQTPRNTKALARSLIRPARASKPNISKFSSSDSHWSSRSVQLSFKTERLKKPLTDITSLVTIRGLKDVIYNLVILLDML